MYYEINVALNGRHFFATAERSITTQWDLEKVYNVLKEKFPTEEGYEITISQWTKIGKSITL